MSASRKEKDKKEPSFSRKLAPILDWAIIIIFVLTALFIIVGYLQPVVHRERDTKVIDGRAFKVQVFGGCGRPDAVMEIAEQFRKNGIDVLEIETESGFTYPYSLIVDRVGNKAVADSLASLLGLSENRVVLQKYNLMLDATIVVGLDYPIILKHLNG